MFKTSSRPLAIFREGDFPLLICCEKKEERIAGSFFPVERVEKRVWKRVKPVENLCFYVNQQNQ